MNLNVTKLNRVTMFVAVVVMAFGLIPSAAAQKYSHRPKPNRFAQQGSTNAAANTVFNGGRDLIDDAQWIKAWIGRKFIRAFHGFTHAREFCEKKRKGNWNLR